MIITNVKYQVTHSKYYAQEKLEREKFTQPFVSLSTKPNFNYGVLYIRLVFQEKVTHEKKSAILYFSFLVWLSCTAFLFPQSSVLFLYFSFCVKLCCTDFYGVYFCCFASVFLTIYVFVLYCFCIFLLVCSCFVLHQLFLRQPKSAAMRLPPQQWSLQQIQIQL